MSETKNPEDMSREEIAAAMAATAETTQSEVPAAEEKPVEEKPAESFSYTAADGTVYTASSSDDLFKKVTAALNHSKEAVRDRERQISELKPKPVEESKKYDHEKYLQLLATDGFAAKRYLEEFDDEAKEQRQLVAETRIQNDTRKAVAGFRASVPEFAKLATPEIAAAFDKRFTESKLPISPETLELVWRRMRVDGSIPDPLPPVEQKKAMPESPSGTGQRRNTKPAVNPESMSREELRKLIEAENAKLRQAVH